MTSAWRPLTEWMRILEDQVIEADAQMQLRQRLAWREFRQSIRNLGDIDLTEGLDRLANLGLGAVRLRVRLEPVSQARLPRLWRWVRRRVGMDAPPAGAFLMSTGKKHGPGALELSVTVTRNADGTWHSEARTDPGTRGEVIHVAHLLD
jgi:hypothetical protein